MNRRSFAVAPGTHKRGVLHDTSLERSPIPAGVIPEDAWRAEDYRAGDLLIFNYLTAHATLPNPSDEIRLSLDVRAVPVWAPQPVVGSVEKVDGTDVAIRTEEGELVTVHITTRTLIRGMNPYPPIPISELERLAYPGSHVMAMADAEGNATVLRRNRY
jgi:hypothetical protein